MQIFTVNNIKFFLYLGMLWYIDKSYPRKVLSVKNLLNGKAISEYILKRRGWSETSNFGCFSFGYENVSKEQILDYL